jgi:hypothetical protein
LNVHVEFPLLQRLALPIPVGTAKFPGIKIHDTRMIRLMEILLHGGTTVGGWTARQIQDALLAAFQLSVARYGLNQLRYEFPVSECDHNCFFRKSQELLQWIDDPSAGFLRFHITEFVEAHGKFSPELTDWLLDRVPIAPYCYMAETFERDEVVVYFRSAKDLPAYDKTTEREHSRRYWSSAYPECSSGDVLKNFS